MASRGPTSENSDMENANKPASSWPLKQGPKKWSKHDCDKGTLTVLQRLPYGRYRRLPWPNYCRTYPLKLLNRIGLHARYDGAYGHGSGCCDQHMASEAFEEEKRHGTDFNADPAQENLVQMSRWSLNTRMGIPSP